MPEEVLALSIIISGMIFILTVLRSLQKHSLKKMEQEKGASSGSSLTTSELRDMIEDAVGAATGPMKDDLESLSTRLDQIEGGGERLFVADESDVQEKTVGRPVRQRQR